MEVSQHLIMHSIHKTYVFENCTQTLKPMQCQIIVEIITQSLVHSKVRSKLS
jgi:hypothetical protein